MCFISILPKFKTSFSFLLKNKQQKTNPKTKPNLKQQKSMIATS
jgi:hypothetical protein